MGNINNEASDVPKRDNRQKRQNWQIPTLALHFKMIWDQLGICIFEYSIRLPLSHSQKNSQRGQTHRPAHRQQTTGYRCTCLRYTDTFQLKPDLEDELVKEKNGGGIGSRHWSVRKRRCRRRSEATTANIAIDDWKAEASGGKAAAERGKGETTKAIGETC